jgi:predicted peroxiredoxin
MADKVLINLATGMEDGERVLIAFLVATAAQQQGKEVAVWATKDAVRLGLPGTMQGEPCDGCPPLERLLDQFRETGGKLWLCPICINSRGLQDSERLDFAEIVGATPMWEWAGNDTTVFSY